MVIARMRKGHPKCHNNPIKHILKTIRIPTCFMCIFPWEFTTWKKPWRLEVRVSGASFQWIYVYFPPRSPSNLAPQAPFYRPILTSHPYFRPLEGIEGMGVGTHRLEDLVDTCWIMDEVKHAAGFYCWHYLYTCLFPKVEVASCFTRTLHLLVNNYNSYIYQVTPTEIDVFISLCWCLPMITNIHIRKEESIRKFYDKLKTTENFGIEFFRDLPHTNVNAIWTLSSPSFFPPFSYCM